MQLRHAALSVAACFSLAASEPSMPVALRTRAESSGFEETSRYDDVRTFLDRLAAISPLVHLDAFGTSEEGRRLPLVILSKADGKPDLARRALPVVLVMANIHAGEVEGKEAAQNLLRRLVAGDLLALTTHLTILVAPIYNADGNERMSLDHRTVQNGPVGGVGTRENAKGLDLNRDYIKAESAETRALLSLITTWDPAVVIDLHTTNGSFHGYHLTWAPALSPNTDSRIADFTRTVLLPPVERSLADAGWRLHRYGNFASAASIESEAEDAASASNPVWRTFDYRPRFGNNYVGLRNRIAVLSEAYSYLGFERRIAVTEAFVASVLREIDRQRDTIGRLVADVDRETARRASDGTLPPFAISATLASSETPPVPILVGAVRAEKNPRSGSEMRVAIEDRHDPVVMRELDRFEPARSIPVPSAYVIPADVMATPEGQRVADLLRTHGIESRRTETAESIQVEAVVVTELHREERTFQGHNTVLLSGAAHLEQLTLAAGALRVSTAQPLSRLVTQLLDPESDDGVVTWNGLDAWLVPGKAVPVYRIVSRPSKHAADSSLAHDRRLHGHLVSVEE
jgi:hypothetical protein